MKKDRHGTCAIGLKIFEPTCVIFFPRILAIRQHTNTQKVAHTHTHTHR